MKKLVLALCLLLLISTGISVVDSTPDETTSPEKQDKTQSQELNESSIIQDSYIIELEGEPKASTLEENSKTQSLDTQSLETRQELRDQRLQETRNRFNSELETVAERPYRVKGEFENAFNGVSVSNISNSTLDEIKSMDEVEKVYKDRLVHVQVQDSVPNIGASKAHETEVNGENITGKGVEVAVIDTGTDYTHPDLGNCTFQEVNNSDTSDCRFLPGYDFVDDEYDPMDEREHGTHVAGIVGANSPEMKGVAPNASIRPYRVCASAGCSTSNILAAVDRAMDPDNDNDTSDHVDVIQISIGGPGYPSDPMSQAMNEAFNAGVLPVISAGNSGSAMETIGDPATARKALAVAAVDDSDRVTQFSSRGPQKVLNSDDILFKPEISAPGYEINSTLPDGSYGAKSGTSMAAPHISGSAALVLQKYSSLGPQEVKSLLTQTSSPVSEDNNWNSVGLLESGTGRVNVTEALATSSVVAPEVVSFGLSNSTGKWWNTSENITVKNFGDVSKTYSISENVDRSGATLEFNESSFTLDPDGEKVVSADLSVNKQELGTGEFTGKISVTSDSGEDLEVSYLFVNQDFSLSLKPESSEEGIFRFRAESPMDFSGYYEDLIVEKPDGSTETTYLRKKGNSDEWRPDNQNFASVESFSQEGNYTAIFNSSMLPGKEASVNFTVGEDLELDDTAGFTGSDILEINVSSSEDIGRSTGRRISLTPDHTLWQPKALNYGGETHIFWDAGGYNTDLRYSKLSGGELSRVRELQNHESGQVQDVEIERKGSKAFVVWKSVSSDSCEPYCNHIYAKVLDLENGDVLGSYSLIEEINETDVEALDTALNGDTVAVGWLDDRVNRPTIENENLSFMARTFDLGSEDLSGLENISYDEPLMQAKISVVSSENGFETFWTANRRTDSMNEYRVYNRELMLNGTKGSEEKVTGFYENFGFSCEGLENETLCMWRTPTSDAGGELYYGSSENGWSSNFLDYSSGGSVITESSGNRLRTVYYNGSYKSGYTESYQTRVYDGSWTEGSPVIGDTDIYEPSYLSGVENPVVGIIKKGEVIPTSGLYGTGLYTASVYDLLSDKNPETLFEPRYPLGVMNLLERENSYLGIFDGKAHSGYYSWQGLSSRSNFLMRVSKKPEADIILPDGTSIEKSFEQGGENWSTNLSTGMGGTFIYRINATDQGFDTETAKSFTTRNVSNGSNSAPGRPEWRGTTGKIENMTPVLNWTEVNDPEGDDLNYIFMLDDNSDFSSPEILKNLEKTSLKAGSLLPKKYYYKVYATDHVQNGKASSGSFEVTEYVNFTLNDNLSVGDDLRINSLEKARFNISKGNWSYSRGLLEEDNYSMNVSLHRYGYYNVTVTEEDSKGNIIGSKTKKVFVNASKPELDYFQIEGRTDRVYPTAMDEFEVHVDYSTEVASLTGSLKASNSTWSREYNTSIERNTYDRENYVTDEEYVRSSIPNLFANVSGLSGGDYNLTLTLGNKAGSIQRNFSVSPYYMNFTVTNNTHIGEDIEISSNRSGSINVSRGNWSYSSSLYSYYDEEKSETIPLFNQGYYNVTVFDETMDGEIFSSNTKKVFVNATAPRIQDISLGSRSNDFPVSGENMSLTSAFDTGVRPLNGSFMVSNSTWSEEYNGSVAYDEVSEQSYITGENYTGYSSSGYPGDTVDMAARVNLTEGLYNITTKARNTEGLSEVNITRRVFEEVNITVKVNQDENVTRSIAFLVENQGTGLAEVNLRESKNVSLPNITSANRSFSMAVASENISDYSNSKMDYIWDINTSINENITVNVTEDSNERRIDNRILYSVFSTSYRGKKTAEQSRILIARNKTEIKQRANSLNNLTIYNCRNYSQNSGECQTDWEEPENAIKNSYRTLELTGLVNHSEAVAVGEPVRPCYPDCRQEDEQEDDEDESSSGGFSGGFAPAPAPEEPEVSINRSSATVSNLETGEASIDSENLSINSVSMPNSSEQDYSMSIEKSSETSDEASESYEVYESYEIDLERDGEDVDETEDEVNISFTVDKAWIEEKGLSREDVSLLHREGDSWEPKNTSITDVRDETVVYSAVTGEFSDYMVGADKEDACVQEVISARSPDRNSCKTFTDSCEVPDNWSQVQSCQIVEDRAQARQLIADLPDDNPDVREAKDAFQAGNYSEALTMARSTNESINSEDNGEFRGDTQSSQQGGLMSLILGALASVVGLAVLSYGSYFGYMKYRKREMLEELNQITEVIRKGMRSGEIRRDHNVLEQIDIARSKIKSGRYDAANEDMKQLKNYLESIRR